ncbi:MAG: C39 family peptidase [Anaerolineae bacterium]|nr:C39 family peptidase [Anaerolineae bacterium]
MDPVYLAVPHLQQRDRGHCLAACAQMILTYLGVSVTYDALLKQLDIKPSLGAPVSNLRFLEKLQLTLDYKTFGTFEDLHDQLRQKQPCLAFIKTGELPYWTENVDHAVVVVGLDDHYIYLNDPAFATAPIQVEQREFDLAWLEWDEKYVVLSLRE